MFIAFRVCSVHSIDWNPQDLLNFALRKIQAAQFVAVF